MHLHYKDILDLEVPDVFHTCRLDNTHWMNLLARDAFAPGETDQTGFRVQVGWQYAGMDFPRQFQVAYSVEFEDEDFRCERSHAGRVVFDPAPRTRSEALEFLDIWSTFDIEAMLPQLKLEIARHIVMERLVDWCHSHVHLHQEQRAITDRLAAAVDEAIVVLGVLYPEAEHPFQMPELSRSPRI